MPTLGEFLRDGLWQLDIDQPASAQEARRSRQHVTRPASGQSMRVLELTPERRITVKFDPAGTNKFGVQLNEHLRLDATAPSDLMSSHANAMAGSMSFQPLTADNCASALSYVYGVVNNIVADSNLRKDPGNAHLWSMWNVEGTTTYLANGIQGSSSTTSGKADAACISNYGSQYAAIGTVVVRLASQLSFEDRTARMGGFGRCVVSKEGLQVYLSAATNQVRAWNCPLENRQAKFWADLVTELWEMMHIYRCDHIVFTSWNRCGSLNRNSANSIGYTPVTGAGCPDEPSSLNMLELLTALALARLDGSLDRFTAFPGTPGKIPRDVSSRRPPEESLPPTLPVEIYGWEPAMCVRAEMFQTYPEDDDTLINFLSGPADGHVLHFGDFICREGPFELYKVVDTTLASDPNGLIVKVAKLAWRPLYTDTKETVSRATVVDKFVNEAQLFCGPLKHLEGTVVANFHGLFEGYYGPDRAGLMFALFQACGEPVALYSHEVSTETAQLIVPLYKALSAAHVVHSDIGVHHLLRRGRDPRIVVVSFLDAWVVDPRKPREMADLLDTERSVYREWGLEVPAHLQNLKPPWELPEVYEDADVVGANGTGNGNASNGHVQVAGKQEEQLVADLSGLDLYGKPKGKGNADGSINGSVNGMINGTGNGHSHYARQALAEL